MTPGCAGMAARTGLTITARHTAVASHVPKWRATLVRAILCSSLLGGIPNLLDALSQGEVPASRRAAIYGSRAIAERRLELREQQARRSPASYRRRSPARPSEDGSW